MYKIIEKSYVKVYNECDEEPEKKIVELEENDVAIGTDLVETLKEFFYATGRDKLKLEMYKKIFIELSESNPITIYSKEDDLYRGNYYKPYVRRIRNNGYSYDCDYMVNFVKDYILKIEEN